ncbi:MAG: hypothetical protein KatS3mg022_1699 [Armatimonadota bacterium]|nr:MAG: hypothetical protein KatS3mg022_1699 [Armatimonadota bacterium]
MKSLLTMIALGTIVATPVQSQPFTITMQAKPRCVIAVARNAPEEVRTSVAVDLAQTLQKVYRGDSIPIQTLPVQQPAIVLATANDFPDLAQRHQLAELGPEGYIIRTEPNRLWLLANTVQGLQHAVQGLLYEIGCRWYFADPVWTVIPHKPTLRVNLNRREQPAFKDRVIWYTWGAPTQTLRQNYQEWFKRNRQGGHFKVRAGHAYENYVPYKEFEQHPEWFGLVDGKRQPLQLCVGNPEVQQRVIQGVLQYFERNPNEQMVSVEPNDGGGHCECEKCAAIGNPSDQAFYLANLAAKAVRARYPDKWVGLLSYAYHSEPPRFPIEKGVYVQVTTGFRYTKLTFEEQVNRIRDLGAAVGLYDYYSVPEWSWDLPGAPQAARFYTLAENIKRYHQMGLDTISTQASIDWITSGPGYWIAAQLMWNPKLDSKTLAEDFFQKAFGSAAKPMKRLYTRWANGERLSSRGLKLALQDLREAYRLTNDPQVRARLDQVAAYLHWVRLWLEYDRVARWDEFGKLVFDPQEVKNRARELVLYTRSITDMGIVHSYFHVFTGWFRYRFAGLEKIPGFSWEQTEEWKREPVSPPQAVEIRRHFEDDLRRLSELVPEAVEILGKQFTGKLVPLSERLPKAVQAWGNVPRSPLFVESGLHLFQSAGNEQLRLTYTPFDSGHTVDCRWSLQRYNGQTVAQGELKAERGQPATLETTLGEEGVYALNPGTDYWKAAQLEFDRRPLSVWCGRADQHGKPPLRLWLPRLDQPLYFYVPKGTRHFVIGIVDGGFPQTTIELRTADGTVVRRENILSGDQLCIIVDEDRKQYGDIAEIPKQTALPSQQLSVTVPKGADGQIWALSLSSLRCVVELYDVPPFVARHPAELLAPEDSL